MLNIIWLLMLVVAVLVGGFTGKLPEVTAGAFEGAEKAVMKVVLPLLGIWAIWLGIMRLAEQSGLVQLLARALRPIMRRLFPEVPAQHPAMGAMVMNMAANMLGLGNAATPLGLRAMRLLESLNPRPGVATNAMVTFLAINTASIQLLPLTAIGILVTAGAKNATAITITAFFASVCAASAGVLASKVLEKLPMFRPGRATASADAEKEDAATEPEPLEVEKLVLPPLTKSGRWLIAGYFSACALIFFLLRFPAECEQVLHWSNAMLRRLAALVPYDTARQWDGPFAEWHAPVQPEGFADKGATVQTLMTLSLLAIPMLLSFFPLYAALRGVKVYEQFVEGAKEAWATAQRTTPYLVAMLVAISMLQKSGVIDLLTQALQRPLGALHFPAELLPMVLMRPLSGSATNGLFVELVQRLHDPDGYISRLAGTIYGSTETTFYVLAVYFGSVSVRQTRHAIVAGLTADTVAVIASVILCWAMFG